MASRTQFRSGVVWVVVLALVASGLALVAGSGPAAAEAPPSLTLQWRLGGGGRFNSPAALATDTDGNVYVADTGNNRIQVFTAAGTYVRSWGTAGAGDGQFGSPTGVAIGPDGHVYVAEIGNNRVQVFTATGAFVRKWGSAGTGDGQFSGPTGVAIGPGGDVYVTDTSNDRVQAFTSAGAFVAKWGTVGTGDGQFNGPSGVAVGADGNVYVADTRNRRVQVFSAAGAFVTKWGTSGSADGQFSSPNGVAIDAGGNVYVADTGNYRVQVFTSAGAFVTKWGTNGSGDGQFSVVWTVAVGDAGNIYVLDMASNRVQAFTSTGAFVTKWGSQGFNGRPQSVAVDGDSNVYVADFANSRIQKYSATGAFATEWGTLGNGNGQFSNALTGVAVGPGGDVYVTDMNLNRVQVFTSSGAFVTKWGASGSGDGQFNGPSGVAVGADGRVYVVDQGNKRVQSFTSSGDFITTWGTAGSGGDGQATNPYGVAVGVSGHVYVTDLGTNRVQEFTSSGAFIAKWGSAGSGESRFNGPRSVASDAVGNVYVADTGNHRIQKFTSSGVFLAAWGTQGSGDSQFNSPFGVAVDAVGNVYVADQNNSRIEVFGDVTDPTVDLRTPVEGATFERDEVVAADFSCSDAPGGSAIESCVGTVADGAAVDTSVLGSHNFTVTATDRAGNVTEVTHGFSVGHAQRVSGTVTETGSDDPVPGALVAVLRATDFSLAGGAVADGSGNYSAAVAPGSYFVYVIDATGAHTAGFFGPPTMVTVPVDTDVDADPTMAPTRGSISGRVIDDTDDTPIANAMVVALTNGGVAEIATFADSNGDYTLGGLRPGNHYVGFVDPNGNHRSEFWPNSLNVPDATTLAVTAGSTTVADSELSSQSGTSTGSLLTGTVVETGTLTPLEDVVVLALHAGDFRLARAATTNSAGQYSLDVQTAAGYKLAYVDRAGVHGFEWHDNQPNTGLGTATTVVAPAVTNAALDNLTGAQAGTITDQISGDPIDGAWVFAIAATGLAGGAVTAPDGTYTIAGLAPGTYRATIVDPNGGRAQEYFQNSPDYDGATPFNITAANTTTVNAALDQP